MSAENLRLSLRQRLLVPINSSATVLQGVYTALWGLWLLGPWHVFSTANIFQVAQSLAPEWAWGLVAIAVGSTIIYGALKPSYRSLATSSGAAFIYWLCIAAGMGIADWHNTGALTYAFVASISAFTYLNVRVNHQLGHDWSLRKEKL